MSGFHMRPAQVSDVPELVSVYLAAFADNPLGQRMFPAKSAETRPFLIASYTQDMKDPLARWLVVTTSGTEDGTGSEQQGEERIVAFAKWIAPPKVVQGSEAAAEDRHAVDPPHETPPFPSDGDAELAKAFFGRLALEHERIMVLDAPATPDSTTIAGTTATADGKDAQQRPHPVLRRHWYLELVATHPSFQRQGAASRLIRYGLDAADSDADGPTGNDNGGSTKGLECYLDATPDGRPIYEHYGFRTVHTLALLPSDPSFRHEFMVRPAQVRKTSSGA